MLKLNKLNWARGIGLLLCITCINLNATIRIAGPSGNSGNAGTDASPLDLQTAINNSSSAGDIVECLDGNYTSGGTMFTIYNRTAGTSNAPIIIRSRNRWKAVITGNSARGFDIFNSFWVIVDGFKIVQNGTDGVKCQDALEIVQNCWITSNGTNTAGSGGQGIASNSSTSKSNVFRFNLIEINGRTTANTTEHGIYFSGQGNEVYGNLVRSNRAWGIHYYTGVAGKINNNSYIYANLTYGNFQKGCLCWPAEDTGGAGNNPGPVYVSNNTFVDGYDAGYGTHYLKGNVITAKSGTTQGIVTNSTRPPVVFADYNLLTNSPAISNPGANNIITNTGNANDIFVDTTKGLFWLKNNVLWANKNQTLPDDGTTYKAKYTFLGRQNAYRYDFGIDEISSDLINDTRDLQASGADPWATPDPIWPSNQRTQWSADRTGVPGGIPALGTMFCNAAVHIPGWINPVADPTGVNDSAPAISAAWNLCPAGQYVYLPDGTYRIDSILTLTGNSKRLVGQSMDNTIVFGHSIGGLFILGSAVEQGTLRNNTVDIPVGGTTTTWDALGDTFPGVGGMFHLRTGDGGNIATENNFYVQDGYSYPVMRWPDGSNPGVATYPVMREMKTITAVNGNTISFWPPAMFNFKANKTGSRYYYLGQTTNSGIENLHLIPYDSPTKKSSWVGTVASTSITMQYADGCWLKNITTHQSTLADIYVQYSKNCEIVGCNISDVFSSGPNSGIGIMLASHVSNCIIYDNIIKLKFPGIELFDGCAGNVFEANYCRDSTGSGLAQIDNHGGLNYYNLYENNYLSYGYIADGLFSSTWRETFFRNRMEGIQDASLGYANTFGSRRIMDLCRGAREFNIINNIFGSANTNWVYEIYTNGWTASWASIYRFGYPNMGDTSYSGTNDATTGYYPLVSGALDIGVKPSMNIAWNYLFTTNGIESPSRLTKTNNTFRYSYFNEWNTSNAPSWYVNGCWPPQGGDTNVTTLNTLPAYNRYFGLTASCASSGGGGGGGGGGATNGGWLFPPNYIPPFGFYGTTPTQYRSKREL